MEGKTIPVEDTPVAVVIVPEPVLRTSKYPPLTVAKEDEPCVVELNPNALISAEELDAGLILTVNKLGDRDPEAVAVTVSVPLTPPTIVSFELGLVVPSPKKPELFNVMCVVPPVVVAVAAVIKSKRVAATTDVEDGTPPKVIIEVPEEEKSPANNAKSGDAVLKLGIVNLANFLTPSVIVVALTSAPNRAVPAAAPDCTEKVPLTPTFVPLSKI